MGYLTGSHSALISSEDSTVSAHGSAAVAGWGHNVIGAYSVVAGGVFGSSGASYSLVIGSHNVIHGNSTQWIPTDDIFIIGNGDPESWGYDRSNAFAVHKNGTTRSSGLIESKQGVRVPPGGDIPMGTFTAGRNPADMGVGLRYTGE